MARPPYKRHKPSQRSPNRTKYTRAPSNIGLAEAPRVKLQQQLARKVVGQRPQDSDDSDRLVTRTRSGRRQHADSQIYASGAVAKGDRPGAFPTKEERMRRLRSDTNEIIRRSRSKSADATVNGLSKSPMPDAEPVANSNSSLAATKPVHSVKSPRAMTTQPQATSGADTSIIGTLKPRRRQASILHLIDNDDSSLINPEDEEQFLPDDISTPAAMTHPKELTTSARPAISSTGSVSRKRKLGQEDLEIGLENGTATVPAFASTSPLSEALSLPSNSTRPRSRTVQEDDDVMAPPQSSSPEPSPEKPNAPIVSKTKKAVSIPTTEQLQSMMPSKRRKGSRQRKQLNEFDIPEDTGSDQLDEPEDESIFQPRKRATKPRNRKGTVSPRATRTKAKATGKIMVNHKQTPKSKSTSSASLPAPPVTPRTPLPLTRKSNQENTPLVRSSRRTGGKNGANVNTHQKATTSRRNGKSPGGSLPTSRRAGLRNKVDAITTGAESDKENQPQSLRRRKIASVSEDPDEVLHPSIETQEDIIDADSEVEREVARGASSMPGVTPAVAKTPMSVEAKMWRQQWANIDDWSLDYEEVSISTSSSSPGRR